MPNHALERGFADWVDRVGDLLLSPRPSFPVRPVLDELTSTFQTFVAWNWADADGTGGTGVRTPVAGVWPPQDPDYWPREGLSHHPLIRWFAVTGDPTAMSMDRVPRSLVSRFAFDQTRDHLRPLGLERQISIPYRLDLPLFRAFVLAKSEQDFHAEQLALARRIQPLLILLDRQCRVLAAPRDETGAEDSWREAADPAGLTGREVAVLRLLAKGHTAAAIAHRLGISPKTVHVHLGHLYAKLGVRDRLLAVQVARDIGLLSLRAPARNLALHPGPDAATPGGSDDGRGLHENRWPTPVDLATPSWTVNWSPAQGRRG